MKNIGDVYCENTFNLFVKYCDKRGFKTMKDLDGFDFSKLKNVKGIGKTKLVSIKDRYDAYFESGKKDDVPVCLVADENRELDIECLKAGGLSSRIIAQLKDAGAVKIGDVVNYTTFLSESGLYLSKNCIKRLDSALDVFKNSPENIVCDCSDYVKSNKFYKLYVKKASGQTLTCIGNEIGLSKERVRQMIKEVEKDLKNLLSIVVTFTLNDVTDKRMFKKSDIRYDIGIDTYVMDYAVKTGVYPKLKYIPELELYLVNTDVEKFCDEIHEILSICIGDVEDILVASDRLKKELKSRGLLNISVDSILDYALEKSYALNDKYIYKLADVKDYYAICIKKHFPDGINIHQTEDLKKLKKYASDTFGIEKYQKNDRSLTVFLTRNLVLCDKGKYICNDDVFIDEEILYDIKRYILSQNKNEFLYSEIYDEFEDRLLENSSVTNKYYLHGVLKMYYKNEFCFTRDILKKH